MNLGFSDEGFTTSVPLKRQVSKVQILSPVNPSLASGVDPPQLVRQITKHLPNTQHFSVESSTGYQSENRANQNALVNVLMIGTGEYTTGYVNGSASSSDKSAGVVALAMLDMKARGIIGSVGLCGVNGTKFPGIRTHMRSVFSKYAGLSELVSQCETWPADDSKDEVAYLQAIKSYTRGDVAIVFTPDDTHFDIALACIRHGMHVLVTKPVVKTLREHAILHTEAQKSNVLVCVEVHKRWDPMYSDARDKIQTLGKFSFLHSYMSQPKHQLETFRAWAGTKSDISYYLNSHHIDFHEWCVGQNARPTKVTAMASTGVAKELYHLDCEDTITLSVEWENLNAEYQSASVGTAVYTASWVAAKSDVHSQQRFFYMGHGGEINIDQAHRGYTMSDDQHGYKSVNPLFMKYTPTEGKFSGQLGYGYRSFSAFIEAVSSINQGISHVDDFAHSLASISSTYRTTAVLEAGRRALTEKRCISILYENKEFPCLPTKLA